MPDCWKASQNLIVGELGNLSIYRITLAIGRSLVKTIHYDRLYAYRQRLMSRRTKVMGSL